MWSSILPRDTEAKLVKRSEQEAGSLSLASFGKVGTHIPHVSNC